MKIWRMLKGPRSALKKVKFIYEPYRKIKSSYDRKRRTKTLQENGLKIVLDVDKLLEHTNACYFIDNGTLLGFIRDGKLIQWDLDIDFGIYITPEFTWKDLEKTLNKIGFRLHHQFRLKNEITEQTYRRGGASIDFFNHINDDDSTMFYCYYLKEGYDYKTESQRHTRLFKTCKISGMKVLQLPEGNVHVPIESESYLEGLYGASWRIPNPEWKDDLSPACICLGDDELGIYEDFN